MLLEALTTHCFLNPHEVPADNATLNLKIHCIGTLVGNVALVIVTNIGNQLHLIMTVSSDLTVTIPQIAHHVIRIKNMIDILAMNATSTHPPRFATNIWKKGFEIL